MSFWDILGTLLIKPLQLLFEVVFVMANRIVGDPGLAIIALSLAMNFLVLPLYRRADAMQEEEREMELRLHKGVAHIKKTFRGDERMMMLQTYYRQNNYKPTYVLKGATSLFLEIPFFIAAYAFLSNLALLHGVSFGPIRDLGAPDGQRPAVSHDGDQPRLLRHLHQGQPAENKGAAVYHGAVFPRVSLHVSGGARVLLDAQ